MKGSIIALLLSAAPSAFAACRPILFNGNVYRCSAISEKVSGPVCISSGIHTTMKVPGFYITSERDEDDQIALFVNDPSNHETASVSASRLKGSYRKYADVWDGRTGKETAVLDLVNGTGYFKSERYNVDGSLLEKVSIEFVNCKRVK